MANKNTQACVCGSGTSYVHCCGRFIDENQIPLSPEQLMRSRYSAYTLQDEAYLLATWHPSTRPVSLSEENKLPVKWVELKVQNASLPDDNDVKATVEFVARYKLNGKAEKLHEVSEFVREDGRWFYLNGQVS